MLNGSTFPIKKAKFSSEKGLNILEQHIAPFLHQSNHRKMHPAPVFLTKELFKKLRKQFPKK